jgi:hypothetical protein
LEKKVSQCHLITYKSQMDWPVTEPGPPDVGTRVGLVCDISTRVGLVPDTEK